MAHKENQELIRTLLECAQECDHCAIACLEEPNVKEMARCIKLDLDCAEICIETSRLLTRKSEVTKEIIKACETICRMCGEECQKHSHMEHCKQCAEACKRCEGACRNYAA